MSVRDFVVDGTCELFPMSHHEDRGTPLCARRTLSAIRCSGRQYRPHQCYPLTGSQCPHGTCSEAPPPSGTASVSRALGVQGPFSP